MSRSLAVPAEVLDAAGEIVGVVVVDVSVMKGGGGFDLIFPPGFELGAGCSVNVVVDPAELAKLLRS